GEADYGEPRANLVSGDDVVTTHARHQRGVDHEGSHGVAHVGGFAAPADDFNAVFAQHLRAVAVTRDDFRDDLAGDDLGVAADGVGQKEGACGAHAQKVVQVHDQTVLGQPAEDGGVAGFLPPQPGGDGFGAGAVRVDQDAVVGAAGERVRQDFAEGAGKKARIFALDGGMDFVFVGRGAAVFVT